MRYFCAILTMMHAFNFIFPLAARDVVWALHSSEMHMERAIVTG